MGEPGLSMHWLAWGVHAAGPEMRVCCAVQGVVDVPIYGRISSLRLFRLPVRRSWGRGSSLCCH